MSIFSSYKKIFLLGFIIAILIAIPFSVYIAQKRQSISSKADASTTLSFDPASPTVKVGEILILNIVLDPKTGTASGSLPNQVSFVKLSISFDSSKFTADSLAPNSASPNTLTSVLEDAVLTSDKATISLSIGADPTKVVTTKTKIAILKLKALSTTSSPSKIEFDPVPNTQVLSIAASDQTSENVLSTTIPAEVTISGTASTTPTPTSAAGASLTPTPTKTASSPSSGGFTGIGSIGNAPVCSSLSVDSLTTGVAPYTLTFTAVGSDSDGTISKVSFNFGDSIDALTVGGGIGTSTVSGQMVHTYKTPGIYTAYAILTDNANNLSNQEDICTKIITINSGIAGTNPTILPLIESKGGLPATGPGEKLLGIGIIGVILTLIGGALLILL